MTSCGRCAKTPRNHDVFLPRICRVGGRWATTTTTGRCQTFCDMSDGWDDMIILPSLASRFNHFNPICAIRRPHRYILYLFAHQLNRQAVEQRQCKGGASSQDRRRREGRLEDKEYGELSFLFLYGWPDSYFPGSLVSLGNARRFMFKHLTLTEYAI